MKSRTTTSLLVLALAFGMHNCQDPSRASCENISRRCSRELFALVIEYRDNPSTIDVDHGCSVLDQAKTCMGQCSDIVLATSEMMRPIDYMCQPSRRDEVKALLDLPCLEGTTVTARYNEFTGYFVTYLMYSPRRDGEQRDNCRDMEDMFNFLQGAITAACGNSAASIYVGMLRYSTPMPECEGRFSSTA